MYANQKAPSSAPASCCQNTSQRRSSHRRAAAALKKTAQATERGRPPSCRRTLAARMRTARMCGLLDRRGARRRSAMAPACACSRRLLKRCVSRRHDTAPARMPSSNSCHCRLRDLCALGHSRPASRALASVLRSCCSAFLCAAVRAAKRWAFRTALLDGDIARSARLACDASTLPKRRC